MFDSFFFGWFFGCWIKEVPSFQLAWFWRNFKITKTYIYRIELLVLSINIENKPLLLMKCFTTEVNKGPFTRNNKKNQRNHRKMPFLGPLSAKPARIPTFFFDSDVFWPGLHQFRRRKNSPGSFMLKSKYGTHLPRKMPFFMVNVYHSLIWA